MSKTSETTNPFRIGSVSYLNARPLIYGLDQRADVALTLEVPSQLLDGLREDRFDVALLPVIDFQRLEGLTVIPAGGIGSDGATLTVRIFSRVPVERIRTLACDGDSHTSVALARVILARRHGLRPEFRDLSRASNAADEARLLIGDKVVCEEPRGFWHQLDLGQAWKEITGLPFVFATWMAKAGVDGATLFRLLEDAKRAGLAHVDEIIEKHALKRGWPEALARQYLTSNLKFDVGERELEAIRVFHRLAAEEGVISPMPRELDVIDLKSGTSNIQHRTSNVQ
jgi:chorismate dehydratase